MIKTHKLLRDSGHMNLEFPAFHRVQP